MDKDAHLLSALKLVTNALESVAVAIAEAAKPSTGGHAPVTMYELAFAERRIICGVLAGISDGGEDLTALRDALAVLADRADKTAKRTAILASALTALDAATPPAPSL